MQVSYHHVEIVAVQQSQGPGLGSHSITHEVRDRGQINLLIFMCMECHNRMAQAGKLEQQKFITHSPGGEVQDQVLTDLVSGEGHSLVHKELSSCCVSTQRRVQGDFVFSKTLIPSGDPYPHNVSTCRRPSS